MPPPWLTGRPGGGDGIVEVVDVVEDGRDIGDPEPVKRDVPMRGAR